MQESARLVEETRALRTALADRLAAEWERSRALILESARLVEKTRALQAAVAEVGLAG